MKQISILILAALAIGAPVLADAKKQRQQYLASAQQSGQLAPQAVERYIIDPFGDADGLVLADGWFVKFPAHQSAQLVQMIKPGDTVAVAGAIAGERAIEAWTLTNTGSNAVLVRTPKSKSILRMPKHLRTALLRPLQAEGRVSHVLYGTKGEVKSALLDSGTTLRLGKHAQWVIGNRLAVGAQVLAKGVGTENEFGRTIEVTEIGFENGPLTSLYRLSN